MNLGTGPALGDIAGGLQSPLPQLEGFARELGKLIPIPGSRLQPPLITPSQAGARPRLRLCASRGGGRGDGGYDALEDSSPPT
jgi:hypothetical protein